MFSYAYCQFGLGTSFANQFYGMLVLSIHYWEYLDAVHVFVSDYFSILVITLICYHGISAQVFAQASVRIIGGEPVQHSDFSWMVSLGWKIPLE